MIRLVLVVLICSVALAMATPAQAQKEVFPEGTVRLMLVDGTAVVGVIEREDESEIVMRTTSGVVMTIPRAQVKSIDALEGERYFRVDPNRTRLLFAPTARAVDKGTGYLAFYEIVVPFAAAGVGSGVTLAGGITINPGSGRFVYAAPKLTVLDRRNVSAAVGAIGVTALGDTGGGTAGLLFAVGTFGPPHAAVSAGVAFGFVEGEFGRNPGLMLGGEYQVSNHVKLLTENYVIVGVEEVGALLSGGIRFFSDRLAADIGLVIPTILLNEGVGFPFVPWLGFAYNFGD